jgi:phosphoribosylanthranilate isomerase
LSDLIVKICGVTTADDARACEAAGADLVGINLWPRSPRCVAPARAAEIVAALGLGRAAPVAVLVDPTEADVRAAVEIGCRYVQVHGDATAASATTVPVIRAVAAAQVVDAPNGVHALLVDSASVGGTGRPIGDDLVDRVAGLARRARVLLAGGLTPETVGAAIRRVRPWGVDVASGVESAPGRKDPAKVRSFVEAARAA